MNSRIKGFEKVTPPVDLRSKVRGISSDSSFDPVENAEKKLEDLSGDYRTWMRDEVSRLDQSWRACRQDPAAEERLNTVFTAAHDLKGQAQTFGFSHAGDVASLICDLLEQVRAGEIPLPVELIDQGINAVSVLSRTQNPDDQTTANAITREYARAVAKFGKA